MLRLKPAETKGKRSFSDMAAFIHNKKKEVAQSNDPGYDGYQPDNNGKQPDIIPEQAQDIVFPVNDPHVQDGNPTPQFALSNIEVPEPKTPVTKASLFGTKRHAETAEQVGFKPLDEKAIKVNEKYQKGVALGQGLGALFSAYQMGNNNPFYVPQESMASPFKEKIRLTQEEYENGYMKARDAALKGELKNIDLDNQEILAKYKMDADKENQAAQYAHNKEKEAEKREYTEGRDEKKFQNSLAIANARKGGSGVEKQVVPDYVAALLNEKIQAIDTKLNDPDNLDKEQLRKDRQNLIKNYDNWDINSNANHRLIDHEAQERVRMVQNQKFIDTSIDKALKDGVVSDEERVGLSNIISKTYGITPEEAMTQLAQYMPVNKEVEPSPEATNEKSSDSEGFMDILTQGAAEYLENEEKPSTSRMSPEEQKEVLGNLREIKIADEDLNELYKNPSKEKLKSILDKIDSSDLNWIDKNKAKYLLNAKYSSN